MRRIFILSALCLIHYSSFSQRLCQGILLDSLNGRPVEFANIGLVGLGVGTVSDEKGRFSFTVPDSLADGQVKVSMIGYRSKYYRTNNLIAASDIYLAPVATALSEVQVVASKTKTKILGNDTRSKMISAGFRNNTLGSEIAIRLRIRHPNTQLRKFLININVNAFESTIFRFNVYSVTEKGWPKENILKQNIIIEPGKKTGLLEVDLQPYNIVVSEDVFIAIEWIKDLGDIVGLTFSTRLVGGSDTYFRRASQDAWKKRGGVGVGLHAEVAY